MNKLYIIPAIIITFIAFSCGNKDTKSKTDDKKEVAVSTTSSTEYVADTESSILLWTGSKKTGTHHGTIKIKSGKISVDGEKITAGNFIIDMTTIKDLDLTDPKENKKLVDDLSSENLFDVITFPTSKFEITSSEKLENADASGNNYSIKGNLTIKDVTKNITIPTKITITETLFTATSKFSISRTEFKLKYAKGKIFKGIGDGIINDTIKFSLDLKATHSK